MFNISAKFHSHFSTSYGNIVSCVIQEVLADSGRTDRQTDVVAWVLTEFPLTGPEADCFPVTKATWCRICSYVYLLTVLNFDCFALTKL